MPLKTSGCWAARPVTISFENTSVVILGVVEQSLLTRQMTKVRWVAAVEAIRFARLAYEEALKYAQENGLDRNQGIRWKLGEMARQVEAAFCWLEGLTYHLNSRPADSHVSLLRMHATKVFEYCAREAAQILGVTATVRGNVIERLAREVRHVAFVGGSEETLLDEAVLDAMKFGQVTKGCERDVAMNARL